MCTQTHLIWTVFTSLSPWCPSSFPISKTSTCLLLSLFHFSLSIIYLLIFFIEEKSWYLTSYVWFLSLYIIVSSSVHFPKSYPNSCFFMTEKLTICLYTTFILSIHLDIEAISITQELIIRLLQRWAYMYLFNVVNLNLWKDNQEKYRWL